MMVLAMAAGTTAAAAEAPSGFEAIEDDRPLRTPLVLPEWFQQAPFDLATRLEAARSENRGLLLYFGQADCPYCKAHIEASWGSDEQARYTRARFDVVAVDVQGHEPVQDLTGNSLTESALARKLGVMLTPTFVFVDHTGSPVLRLEGYQDTKRFRRALDYVNQGRHRDQSFRRYFRRHQHMHLAAFEETPGEANKRALDALLLDRSKFEAEKPLLVIFESVGCADCERFATGPLKDRKIARMIERVETARVDIESAAPVLTPDGELLTARGWAERLGVFHTPTLMFFDRRGRELLRVESPVSYYRLNDLLEFVLSGAYQRADFQLWRREQGR